MHAEIGILMNWRAKLIMSGRYEDLARQHLFPLPVYSSKTLHPFFQARDLEAAFRSIHADLLTRGTTDLTVKIHAVELPRLGRFRVWSDWLSHVPGNAPVVVASAIHFMRATDQGLRTEMVECSTPSPAVLQQKAG